MRRSSLCVVLAVITAGSVSYTPASAEWKRVKASSASAGREHLETARPEWKRIRAPKPARSVTTRPTTAKLTTKTEPRAEVAGSAARGDCVERWRRVEETGLVHGPTNGATGTPSVTIDEEAWSRLEHLHRVRLMETIQCVTVGPDKVLPALEIRSRRTSQVIGEWSGRELRLN